MKKWKKLYGASGTFVCPYCLQTFPIKDSTRDHLVPRSRGGRTEPANIILCCKECNSQKGALTPEEYAYWKQLEFIRNGGLSR